MKLFKKLLPIVLVLSLVLTPSSFAVVGDTIAKAKLSGSTDGKAIEIGAGAVDTANAVLIHTAVATTTPFDEIYLWAYNAHTAPILVTIEWGVHADADNVIAVTVPEKSGLFMLIPGLILQNGMTVEIFASVAEEIFIHGYVHKLS